MANLYLHFGDLPENGRSVCHTLTDGTWFEGPWWDLADERKAEFEAVGYEEIDGVVYEPGLSVFRLEDEDSDTLTFDATGSNHEDVLEWVDRPAYLVKGTKLADGIDGETLISVAGVVGRACVLSYAKAAGYDGSIVTVRRA